MAINGHFISDRDKTGVGSRTRQVDGEGRSSLRDYNKQIPSAKPHAAYELSFPQERMWLWDQLAPHSPLYNVPYALRIRGALNVEALQRSVDHILDRHEVLRTCYSLADGQPVQTIHSSRPVELTVHDISALPEKEKELTAQDLANHEVRRPFDLAKDLMLRAALMRLSPTDCVLTFTMHHIAADGWSLGVFLRELSETYMAYAQGCAPNLTNLQIQYKDFAVWQRAWFDNRNPETLISYWADRLAGIADSSHVMTDYRKSANQSFHGAWERLVLPERLASALATFSQQRGVSPFMTFLAAFQTLLHRYSGHEDIVLGYPIANRNRLETANLIGYFANTLVFREDLSCDPSFLELVGRVRDSALSDYQHQDLPFEKLIEAVQSDRNGSQSPIFQTFFIFQNSPMPSVQLPGLSVSRYEVDTATAKFDLTVFVEKKDGTEIAIEYNRELFDADTIKRMLLHYEVLLGEVAAHPEKRIGEMQLLTDDERRQALVGWNETKRAYPQCCIHQLFEQQVSQTPEATAATYEEKKLSYAELDRRANRLARRLRGMGVGPNVPVGICVPRSLEMFVGLIGILKAGGAYVPLDPNYPPERLRYMMEDAGISILLTQGGVQVPHGSEVKRIDLDSQKYEVTDQQHDNIAVATDPEKLAYIIYTSGSTGKPKGVAIPHRAVVNLLNSMRKRPGLRAEDTLVAVTTLSFDIACLELFLPLCVGARVVIASREVAADGKRLLSLLRSCGATVMQATPVTWKMLLEAGWEGNPRLKVLCGGEAFPRELANQLLKQAASVWNMYGPTETSIWSAVKEVRAGEGPVPIGPPIDNTQFHVLDAHGQLCPSGVPGELHIEGAGLAVGYFRKPELSGQKFLTKSLGDGIERRLYRTGDSVRRMLDGSLEFLGRLDEQTKVRGYRIELGEIEATLSHHSAVQESVVVVREDASGEKQLVAYVVPKGSRDAEAGELRSFLRNHLPEYMVPAFYVVLDRMPLTLNGKIDRRALPTPKWVTGAGNSVLPRTQTEHTLVEIWKDVLGLKQLGVQDNFFELGGHSLAAVRMLTVVEQRVGGRYDLSALLSAPTIEEFAAWIDGSGSPNTTPVPSNRNDRLQSLVHRQSVRSRSVGVSGFLKFL